MLEILEMHSPKYWIPAIGGIALAALVLIAWPDRDAGAKSPAGIAHVHGLATQAGGELILATHDGIVALDRDGAVTRVSENRDDFMALSPVPGQAGRYLASGHPVSGGNLGLVMSADGGKSWKKLSDGLNGPADFHLLTVSSADADHVFGFHDGIQHSVDGGKTWNRTGFLPERTFSISASSVDAQRLYAAAQSGLFVSDDAGANWRPLKEPKLPASLVKTTADGNLYAFVAGEGLLVATEAKQDWSQLNDGFGSRIPVQLSVSPVDPDLMHALDHVGSLWRTVDGGKTWEYYLHPEPLSETERLGKDKYDTLCASCHGAQGVGEKYSAQRLSDPNYLAAPALDGSAHAWHHSDDQLVGMILDGLPRESRMPKWKGTLDEADARAIVAYMKSLWGPRELHCQGAKHMNCDYQPN